MGVKNRKIILAEGLLWEGKVGEVKNILSVIEADKIAQSLGFVFVERLVNHYKENTVLLLGESLKDIKVIEK